MEDMEVSFVILRKMVGRRPKILTQLAGKIPDSLYRRLAPKRKKLPVQKKQELLALKRENPKLSLRELAKLAQSKCDVTLR